MLFENRGRSFRRQQQRWIGTVVLVYEPTDSNIVLYNLPLISTETPFLPVSPKWIGMHPTVFAKESAIQGDMPPLFAIVDDLHLLHENLTVGCAAPACDGYHARTKQCFALETVLASSKGVFSCKISWKTLNVYGVPYMSRDFATYFVHETYIQVRKLCCLKISIRNLQHTVESAYSGPA